MEQVLLVVQVIIAAALIGMVLIQRSDSDGFGLGGGGGSGLMSGRAKANLLTRTTAIIATLFIMNSLALSLIAAHSKAPSIVDAIEAADAKATVAEGETQPGKKSEDMKKKAPAVPNADETSPAPKAAKKVKAAVDAGVNADKTGGNKSE